MIKQVSTESFFKKAKKFLPEVRQEMKRVVWPTRKETIVTTVFVFGFAVIAALYFLLVDQVVYRLVKWIIGFGS